MNTGDSILCIQIPNKEAFHLLRSVAHRYGWENKGPFHYTSKPIFPCYIKVHSKTYDYAIWQDDLAHCIYFNLRDDYHNGIPYTKFLEMQGITVQLQSYEYW